MTFKIVAVDLYGYNGRDHHPENSDIGLTVVPIKMDVQFYQEDESQPLLQQESANGFFLNPDALPYLFGKTEEESGIECCWTCVTEDGRILELMDFEVERV